MTTLLSNSKIRNILLLVYVLAVLGFSAAARANTLQQELVHAGAAVQAKTAAGEVIVTPSGEAYLVVSDILAYELQSDELDLTQFNGQYVVVNGLEVLHKVGPAYQLASFRKVLDSDIEESQTRSAPVLIVMQITELAQ